MYVTTDDRWSGDDERGAKSGGNYKWKGKRRWEELDGHRDDQDDLALDFFRGDELSPCSAARFFFAGVTAAT